MSEATYAKKCVSQKQSATWRFFVMILDEKVLKGK